MNKRKHAAYKKDYPALLYRYFSSFSGEGAPSYGKFARSQNLTLADLERFRKYDEFDRAFRECSEIRRDYLIDCALGKRADASLVKFLLASEYGMGEKAEEEDKSLSVTLTVVK